MTKNIIIGIMISIGVVVRCCGQNIYNFQTKIEVVELVGETKDAFGRVTRPSYSQVIQTMCNKNNQDGFSLKLFTVSGQQIILAFEKSASPREEALYNLLNDLNAKIEATSKKHTEAAMVSVQTNVLNYLKSIPNDVLTQAYKDELTKMILLEAEEKIVKVVDEIKKEITVQKK